MSTTSARVAIEGVLAALDALYVVLAISDYALVYQFDAYAWIVALAVITTVAFVVMVTAIIARSYTWTWSFMQTLYFGALTGLMAWMRHTYWNANPFETTPVGLIDEALAYQNAWRSFMIMLFVGSLVAARDWCWVGELWSKDTGEQ